MNTIGINDLGTSFKIATKVKEPSSEIFSELINNVIESGNVSKNKMMDFMGGKETEIHEVMIAAEKARTDFQLLVELRNKSVDMYKELTRIQV